MRPIAALGLAALLAACAAPPPAPQVPQRVLDALPPDIGPNDVRQRTDGCWFIVIDDELSGIIRPVEDRDGRLICDDI